MSNGPMRETGAGGDGPSAGSSMGSQISVDLVDPQGLMFREIADKRMTRDDVALTYAYAIRQHEVDQIAEVNQTIIERWSMAALRYIKEKAWRLQR